MQLLLLLTIAGSTVCATPYYTAYLSHNLCTVFHSQKVFFWRLSKAIVFKEELKPVTSVINGSHHSYMKKKTWKMKYGERSIRGRDKNNSQQFPVYLIKPSVTYYHMSYHQSVPCRSLGRCLGRVEESSCLRKLGSKIDRERYFWLYDRRQLVVASVKDLGWPRDRCTQPMVWIYNDKSFKHFKDLQFGQVEGEA